MSLLARVLCGGVWAFLAFIVIVVFVVEDLEIGAFAEELWVFVLRGEDGVYCGVHVVFVSALVILFVACSLWSKVFSNRVRLFRLLWVKWICSIGVAVVWCALFVCMLICGWVIVCF